MKFSDIALNRVEAEQIQQEVERRQIDIKTDEGQLLLKALVQEFYDGIWSNRDYTPGDEGGDPAGMKDY